MSHSDSEPDMPPYEISGWDCGIDGFEMSVRVNGYWFAIAISPNNFSSSPLALGLFHEIFSKIDADEDHKPEVWEYSKSIAGVFVPDFKRLAPPVTHTGKLTLADLRTRGTYECKFCVSNEKRIAIAVTERAQEAQYVEEWDVHKIQSSFPILRPNEVEVPYTERTRIYDIIPQEVFVNGKRLFYKSSWSPYDPVDEIGKYAKIMASDVPREEFLVSHLFAIVAPPSGQAIGLLYEWIETGDQGRLTSRISNAPVQTQQKWADQIQQTVSKLHELGIVWGNVKSDNVLIDNGGNAVIVDLEGGTTRGWVDRDVGGTLEGDKQGIGRLMDFILNDESPLRRAYQSDDGGSEIMDED